MKTYVAIVVVKVDEKVELAIGRREIQLALQGAVKAPGDDTDFGVKSVQVNVTSVK